MYECSKLNFSRKQARSTQFCCQPELSRSFNKRNGIIIHFLLEIAWKIQNQEKQQEGRCFVNQFNGKPEIGNWFCICVVQQLNGKPEEIAPGLVRFQCLLDSTKTPTMPRCLKSVTLIESIVDQNNEHHPALWHHSNARHLSGDK